MKRSGIYPPLAVLALTAAIALPAYQAFGAAGHAEGDPPHQVERLEQMQEQHRKHEHGHDFEAMEEVSAADMERVMGLMMDVGLALPPMDGERGRDVFLNKGCVVCHAVNDVGGLLGPSLNAADMPQPMNAFEFSARMWRGAPAMAELQADVLGEIITLDGQELADLVAFAHDEAAQATLTTDQIPERFRDLIIE
ncbi:MAG: c-type cytochrome [Alphaproteobacteria bacterium]